MKIRIEQLNYDGKGNSRVFHRYPRTEHELEQALASIHLAYNMNSTVVTIIRQDNK